MWIAFLKCDSKHFHKEGIAFWLTTLGDGSIGLILENWTRADPAGAGCRSHTVEKRSHQIAPRERKCSVMMRLWKARRLLSSEFRRVPQKKKTEVLDL
mmetsp:Transcript_10235/g.14819  ORF Transcript_10235/g.14819 Transcript_10235/m.14819 type:complete len:98 (-) Transcript_10235:1739-2032(-)